MITALAVGLVLLLLRVSAFLVFLPPFAGANVPRTVKVGLAVCLTVLWSSKVVPATALELNPALTGNWMLLGWLAVRETLFGIALGWLLGLILVPVRIAGAYIVQETGLTIGTITSATESTETNVVSQLLEVAAVLFILGANVHHQFLRLLDFTFDAFPLGHTWQLPERDWIIGSITSTSDQGLGIAAPVGVLLFATLIATLFIMRQTPQFNLFTFGMPVRLVVGLAALLVFLPGILGSMVQNILQFVRFQGL